MAWIQAPGARALGITRAQSHELSVEEGLVLIMFHPYPCSCSSYPLEGGLDQTQQHRTKRRPYHGQLGDTGSRTTILPCKAGSRRQILVKHWNKLPTEVPMRVESPSLEGLKRYVDMALRDMV